jgi:Domain of unknown function (DUF4349)
MRWIMPLCLLGLLVLIGCSKKSDTTFTTVGQKIGAAAGNSDASKEKTASPTPSGAEVVNLPDDGLPNQPAKGDQPEEKKEKQRKIRYSADMRLIVDDFAKAEKDLEAAIEESKGKLASSELNSVSNAVRTGTWRVRVPVEKLHTFRAAVAKIGEVELNKLDSEDLTDRYYDLEAHIKNRNAERDALRDLLKEVGKKEIKHYLEIKRELDSVTDDINRKEGQLRLWANLTDLTTCTVHLREKQKYIAEKKIEEKEVPTFGMRADKTWGESLEAFLGFCQWAVLALIALTPWLPALLVLGGGLWLFARRIKRVWSAPPVEAVVEEAPAKPA